MKTIKTAVIESMSNEALQAEIGKFEASYNSATIEFKNSKGAIVACPANLINGAGQFTGDKASDKEGFAVYMATYLRVRHEAAKGEGTASVSSGKATLTIRTCVKGIEHTHAKVATQWEAAQALAKTVSKLRQALRTRLEAAASAKVNADMADYVTSLCGTVAA